MVSEPTARKHSGEQCVRYRTCMYVAVTSTFAIPLTLTLPLSNTRREKFIFVNNLTSTRDEHARFGHVLGGCKHAVDRVDGVTDH